MCWHVLYDEVAVALCEGELFLLLGELCKGVGQNVYSVERQSSSARFQEVLLGDVGSLAL